MSRPPKKPDDPRADGKSIEGASGAADRDADRAGEPESPENPQHEDTDGLSPRARRIKAMIEAGTYEVDLDGLADAIAASGDLERVGPDRGRPPANDQRRDDDD